MTTKLTERGQVSMPADVRKKMGLRPGATLRWEPISPRECRVIVENSRGGDPLAALGFGPKARGENARRTKDWMRELRDGD